VEFYFNYCFGRFGLERISANMIYDVNSALFRSFMKEGSAKKGSSFDPAVKPGSKKVANPARELIE